MKNFDIAIIRDQRGIKIKDSIEGLALLLTGIDRCENYELWNVKFINRFRGKVFKRKILQKDIISNVAIDSHEIEFSDEFHDDAGGVGASWRCPNCGEKVSWAPGMWWDMDCICRTWSFNYSVTGETLKGED